MDSVASDLTPLTSNFLVPNATFFVELIAFAIILFVLGKWVIPPINRAMTARQEAIRKQFDDLEQAKSDARAAEEKYTSQLENAKHEAARIREEARDQGSQIVADAREKANQEAQRVVDHAHDQIEADRQQTMASLRGEVGSMATTLAGKIVGESLDDDERQGRVVSRFLDELDSKVGSN
ncbi:MAG: F0F1 ATP synthase subunit B [Marmoricola sp.]